MFRITNYIRLISETVVILFYIYAYFFLNFQINLWEEQKLRHYVPNI